MTTEKARSTDQLVLDICAKVGENVQKFYHDGYDDSTDDWFWSEICWDKIKADIKPLLEGLEVRREED